MQKEIHPIMNAGIKVLCACGNTFATDSTIKEIRTELCSACHPFYTGKQKLVDTARRVEKLAGRFTATKSVVGTRGNKKERRAKRDDSKKDSK
ncbi:MAG: 50S ribosomal protein L31 [bacterium]